MEHIKTAEDFFECFAGSEIDMPDYDALCEIFQGVCDGFFIEVLEINDGEYFLLVIAAHDSKEWNISGKHPQSIPSTGQSIYRFNVLPAALEALAAFQMAAICQ